ncbi:MAG: DUF4373 domain-containing protein [Muribaculaceae bacterium]
MARTSKIGLDYFPMDIDIFNDLRIRKLIKYQGGKAVTVYALLLCNIYKCGYYMEWDKELPFICSELTGFEEVYISEVIKTCLTLGLFSKELFEENEILTSIGIQKRYSRICAQCRRICNIVEYNLIEPQDTSHKVTSTPNDVPPQQQYDTYSLTLDQEIDALKQDECWLDQLQVLHAIDKKKLCNSLDDFRVQCVADGKDRHLSFQDAKQHFNAWLRIVNSKKYKKDDKDKSNGRNQRRCNILNSDEKKKYGGSF